MVDFDEKYKQDRAALDRMKQQAGAAITNAATNTGAAITDVATKGIPVPGLNPSDPWKRYTVENPMNPIMNTMKKGADAINSLTSGRGSTAYAQSPIPTPEEQRRLTHYASAKYNGPGAVPAVTPVPKVTEQPTASPVPPMAGNNEDFGTRDISAYQKGYTFKNDDLNYLGLNPVPVPGGTYSDENRAIIANERSNLDNLYNRQNTEKMQAMFTDNYKSAVDNITSRINNVQYLLDRGGAGYWAGQNFIAGGDPKELRKELGELMTQYNNITSTAGNVIPNIQKQGTEQSNFLRTVGVTDATIKKYMADAMKTEAESKAVAPSFAAEQAGKEKIASMYHPPKDNQAAIMKSAVDFAKNFQDPMTGEFKQAEFEKALPGFLSVLEKHGLTGSGAAAEQPKRKPTFEEWYSAMQGNRPQGVDDSMMRLYYERTYGTGVE